MERGRRGGEYGKEIEKGKERGRIIRGRREGGEGKEKERKEAGKGREGEEKGSKGGRKGEGKGV